LLILIWKAGSEDLFSCFLKTCNTLCITNNLNNKIDYSIIHISYVLRKIVKKF